jgi:hypothetical protein
MLVTSVSGTTFTVTRAQESTSGAAHLNGAYVNQTLTVGALNQFRSDNISTGTTASLPAAGTAGRLYLPTDGPYIYQDNGSSWGAFGPVYALTPPVSGNFSWVNQGDATLDTSNGAMTIVCPSSNGSAESHRLRVLSIPSAPYTATFGLMMNFPNPSSQLVLCGPTLRLSGSGQFITFSFRTDSGDLNFTLDKYTNATTYSGSSYVASAQKLNFLNGSITWLRIQDDNVNRIFSISKDGYHFQQVFSVGRTDFITPDQIGIDLNPYQAPASLALVHYKTTQP